MYVFYNLSITIFIIYQKQKTIDHLFVCTNFLIFHIKAEEKELTAEDGALVEVAEEETEANPPVSEQMEAHMSQILEKIDNFTQQVTMFIRYIKFLNVIV